MGVISREGEADEKMQMKGMYEAMRLGSEVYCKRR